ncbi:MAG TPA: PTS sugar transporter subunit IIB, partial [Dongiaceae bacterium]|nr:PTS sugar transporter subunit IIB [Dongiaceae bacterium]
MSWVLHRVDDRLIHGQVLVAWGARLSPARIWLADDAVAAADWERQVYRDAAPGIDVRVAPVAEVAAAYAGEAAAAGGAFLIVRDLVSARRLVEAGAAVPAFNVGGLHYAPGRTKLNEYVYLDDAERGAARALLARGVTLEAQDVPASRAQPLAALEP